MQAFEFSGKIISGEKVGRKINFPTANLDRVPDENQLNPGVYVGTCLVLDRKHNCLVYFGPRYVFNEKQNSFEVYIYGFSKDIYGEKIEVTLTNFIRPPINISSLEELQLQLEQDKAQGLELLNS